METFFSSDEIQARDRYRKWLAFSDERFMPMVHTRTSDDAFDASARGVDLSDLAITRASFDALKLEATARTIRHPLNKPDVLGFSIKISGDCIVEQFGRSFKQKNGDISIVDANEPFSFVHLQRTDHLIIQIPRHKLEDVLGPARNFAAVPMTGSGSTTLVKTFFRELLLVHDQMDGETVRRMAAIGIDLIVASLAEGLAREAPRSLQGTVAVQKAKLYITSNLSDPDLNSSRVAAAVGISLRHLQAMFSRDGLSLAEWIWMKKLDVAAARLVDRAYKNQTLGMIAYGCGFVNQAHFSRRFREQYGMTPTEYRKARHAVLQT